MKRFSLLLTLIFMASISFSQVESDSVNMKGTSQATPMDVKSAHYPGGFDEMQKFINANINIPDSVRKTTESTRIILKITIDTTGTLKDISLLKSVNETIDKEFLRVFAKMPKWVPGERDGKKFAQTLAIPIAIDYSNINGKK